MDTEQKAKEIITHVKGKIKGARFSFIKVPIWEAFANDIAFVNRFMLSDTKTDVNNFLDHILQKDAMHYYIPKGTLLYRARKIDRKKITKDAQGNYIGYSEKESGMPPYRSAPYGRAGASGIPVFYTSTESKTSCAELRPTKGEYISIAEYEVKEDILLADFSLEQIEAVDGTIEGRFFLKEMFTSFSMPVTSEYIDYLPSEYVSEYIRTKHTEILGIRYSSLHNIGGYNIALFSENQCEFKRSSVVECTYVSCEFQDINEKH